MRHAFRIIAIDNHVIALSTAEVSSDFGNVPAPVAYERDGKPLDTPRLVIPGDEQRHPRCPDVVTITVE